MIVVANREPYSHRFAGDSIECIRPASGMASALDPIIRASGGIWVAHGSGDADRLTVDEHDHVRVPPEDPTYTLRRVWLTKEQEEGYYHGLANEGLWPLCHVTFTRPVFDAEALGGLPRGQRALRRRRAGGGRRPADVRVHPGLPLRAPAAMLKDRRTNLIVAQFWHIPWPNRETFRVFPWKEELLDGLLGNDLLGFHLRYHCQNFLETVGRERSRLGSTVRRPRSSRRQSQRSFGPSPSASTSSGTRPWPPRADVERQMQQFRKMLNLRRQDVWASASSASTTPRASPSGSGRSTAFLEEHPELSRALVFVQIGVPSRQHVPAYQVLDDEIDRLVERDQLEVEHRPLAADRLLQATLRTGGDDGPAPAGRLLHRQLAARRDEPGRQGVRRQPARRGRRADPVRFTGSARELADALQFNPFAVDELQDAIVAALEMARTSRKRRMQRMRRRSRRTTCTGGPARFSRRC